MNSRWHWVWLCICISVTPVSAQQSLQTGIPKQQFSLNIPSQPLEDALNSFSRQTHLKLAFYADLGRGLISPRIAGNYTPEVALRLLLANTGLRFKYIDPDSIAILPNEAGAKPNEPGPNSPVYPNKMDKEQEHNREDERGLDNNRQHIGALEDIVVTAQKRSENLQTVPSSLTALSAEILQNQGVVNFADYMTLVPSLSDFSGGAEGHGAMILRGLNTGYYQFSNTVGYYIDDVPFSATSPLSYGAFLTMDPDLTDIDQLEVLKGPQATLYGASTLGGLIKVVTKKPDLNVDEGEVRLDGSKIDGGGTGYGIAGIANLVFIPGELALRVSGFDRDNPGYMTNIELGTKDRPVSRKKGGRASLRWVPAEGLEIKVSAFLQSLHVIGWNYEDVNLQTLEPLTGPYTYSARYDPTFHTTYEVYNAAINYNVGAIGTLTSSTSYAKYRDREVEDYSLQYGIYYNAFAPQPLPAGNAALSVFGVFLDKFSEELRFTSQRLGAFEWLAGLFYTREQINFPDSLRNAIPPSLQPISGPDGQIITIGAPATYKEEAAFANLTYYFGDKMDLTLGGRYSQNRQKAAFCLSGFAVIEGCVDNRSSDTDFTYLAALRWHPALNIHTYARIATSYRPGGPQQEPVPGYPTSFKPDSLINYEVGLKGDWLDHRLRTNLALYDMRWKDVQLTSNIAGFSVISNAGKATVKGIELETQIVPIEHLTLGMNVAYTDAKLDSVSADVSAVTGAVAGNTLPFTPSWSASAVADYVQRLSGTVTSSYGLTYRYQGSKWSDYPGDPLNTGVVIPHYNTLDIRAGLNWSRYQLQARVANLFNAHGQDSVVDQRILGNPPAWAAITRPRTFALSLVVSF